MKTINLRKYYPFYKSDCYIEVSDDIAAMLYEFDLHESAYRQRTYRHKAYYSLDLDDGIENDALLPFPSAEDTSEFRETYQELFAALASLTKKQARRVYAHYFLGMHKADIARTEGVDDTAVCDSIKNGLRNMRAYFEKHHWQR